MVTLHLLLANLHTYSYTEKLMCMLVYSNVIMCIGIIIIISLKNSVIKQLYAYMKVNNCTQPEEMTIIIMHVQ